MHPVLDSFGVEKNCSYKKPNLPSYLMLQYQEEKSQIKDTVKSAKV